MNNTETVQTNYIGTYSLSERARNKTLDYLTRDYSSEDATRIREEIELRLIPIYAGRDDHLLLRLARITAQGTKLTDAIPRIYQRTEELLSEREARGASAQITPEELEDILSAATKDLLRK